MNCLRFALLGAFALVQCSGNAASPTTATQQQLEPQVLRTVKPPPGRPALIYVADACSHEVASFSAFASGAVVPRTVISGPHTRLESQTGLFVDDTNLWVTSFQHLLRFDPNQTGDTPPLSFIGGNLSVLNATTNGVSIDLAGREYVTNFSPPAIDVFAQGATFSATPQQQITGPATGLVHPTGLALDSSQNIWIADVNGQEIEEFSRLANRNAAPLVKIAGPATQLSFPFGVFVDTSGNIWAVNVNGAHRNTVLEFAHGAHGNVAPIHVITGPATQLSTPYGVTVDQSGFVYVANSGLISGGRPASITVYRPGSTGNAAPVQLIEGGLTTLGCPTGIAVH